MSSSTLPTPTRKWKISRTHWRTVQRPKKSSRTITNCGTCKGFCHFKQRNHDAAIACFEKAIEIDPKSGIDYANIGSNLRDKGDAKGAIAMYEKALSLDPTIEFARDGLKRLSGTTERKGDRRKSPNLPVRQRFQPMRDTPKTIRSFIAIQLSEQSAYGVGSTPVPAERGLTAEDRSLDRPEECSPDPSLSR